MIVGAYTWSDNNVRKLITVKVLNTSLRNTTVVAFKTILELVLWNELQSCCCITPDVINVIKMPSFQYFLSRTEKSHWELDQVNRQGVPTQLCV